jgi:histidine decarboxylase
MKLMWLYDNIGAFRDVFTSKLGTVPDLNLDLSPKGEGSSELHMRKYNIISILVATTLLCQSLQMLHVTKDPSTALGASEGRPLTSFAGTKDVFLFRPTSHVPRPAFIARQTCLRSLRPRAAREADRISAVKTEEKRRLAEFIGGVEGRTPKVDDLYDTLTRFYRYPLNNLGEVDDETYVRNNTKVQERELLDFWARHFKIAEGYGGHVTIGRQQAELYAMFVAQSRFPKNAIFYLSSQVDDLLYCSLQILGVSESRIRLIKSSSSGEIDYSDLDKKVREGAGRPAIVCLNAGRFLGGVDDVGRVRGILGRAGIKQKHIHYSMSPVSMGESFLNDAFKIDFKHGVDSMTLPMARFVGSPIPGAIILTKKEYVRNISRGQDRVEYVNVEDTTIPGSRSGHAPLYLWLATKVMGPEGFKARAKRGKEVCLYIKKVFDEKGYPCRLHERGDAIIFKQPSDRLRRKWGLLSYRNESCFEAIPYMTKVEIAEFINDLLRDNLSVSPQPKLVSTEEVAVSEAAVYVPSKKILATLDELEERIKRLMGEFLGFPANIASSEESYGALHNLFKYILSKEDAEGFGQTALSFFSNLYGVRDGDVFSGVTAGGTWGNLIGILAGRERFPRGILYYSEDSHYSIDKVARVLGMEVRKVKSLPNGEIDYDKLEEAIKANRGRPVILNLNIGTTMKGATDDPRKVVDILQRNNITNYHIHCDAALHGMLHPFIDGAPQINLARDVHSIAISGHKFMGLPMPSGIFMVRKSCIGPNLARRVDKLLTAKTGYVLFYLWYAVTKKGYDGFKKEALLCVDTAQYLHRRLREIGYPCGLNEFSNIVVLARPSERLIDKWQLAPYGDITHVVTMQHVTREKIDRFIGDLIEDMKQHPRGYVPGDKDLLDVPYVPGYGFHANPRPVPGLEQDLLPARGKTLSYI